MEAKVLRLIRCYEMNPITIDLGNGIVVVIDEVGFVLTIKRPSLTEVQLQTLSDGIKAGTDHLAQAVIENTPTT